MLTGEARANIASGFVSLHSRYYGRGPTKSKVYEDGDMIAVVLEETFTPAERTLIDQGQAEGVQEIRRNFQQIMAVQFKALVEQGTGRKVRSFLSETDLGTTSPSRCSSSPTNARTWPPSRRSARTAKASS